MDFNQGNQVSNTNMRFRGSVSNAARPPRTGHRTNGRGRLLLTDTQWRSIGTLLGLSTREFQIVQCIFDDMKEAAIAHELSISAHTVHTHIERLYRKTGVSNRCSLLIRIFAEFISPTSGPCLKTAVPESA
ncbi:MAG: helix-turn-helix transcriptional regulator [Phycisphaerales bacterium]|nr:helix-turn-helix transcriptional regulator [Phycisphaerales bacterium]